MVELLVDRGADLEAKGPVSPARVCAARRIAAGVAGGPWTAMASRRRGVVVAPHAGVVAPHAGVGGLCRRGPSGRQ